MNREERKSRWLAVIVTFLITAAAVTFCYGLTEGRIEEEKEEEPERTQNEELLTGAMEIPSDTEIYKEGKYILAQAEGDRVIFENQTDGYRITVPREWTGRIQCTCVGTRLEGRQEAMEIFCETFSTQGELSSYLQYSDQFLEDRADHTEQKEERIQTKEAELYLTWWTRPSLSRVEEDKPYYLCIDVIPSGGKDFQRDGFFVCTLQLQGENPIERQEALAVAESLEILETLREKDGAEQSREGQGSDHQDRREKPEGKEAAGAETGQVRDYWSLETKQAYQRIFGDTKDITWGIFEFSAPEDFTALSHIEEQVDYTFDILLYYQHFEKEGPPEEFFQGVKNAAAKGRILELTLQTTGQKEGNMVYDILNGEMDEYLKAFARAIRQAESPVLFRLCNEMNGDWCQYSAFHTSRDPELFCEMYRYVFHFFEEQGALPYMIFIWNPNETSFPGYKWNHQWHYYPGDGYVDVVGLTGYNTGTYYEGEDWRSFDEIYAGVYERAAANYQKPLMITEFASSSVGGNKPAWIQDMFYQIRKYDRIKAAVWWNGRDLDSQGNVARPYWLNENEKTLEAFREGIHDWKKEGD